MALCLLDTNTNNFYENLFHEVHNQLFQLTLKNSEGRDPRLSIIEDDDPKGTRLKNLEMNPIVIESMRRDIEPAAFIRADSAGAANELDRVLGDFVEEINIRIELYLGCDNDAKDLTTKTTRLIRDFQTVLNPRNFIGSLFSEYSVNPLVIISWQDINDPLSISSSNDLSDEGDPLPLLISLEDTTLTDSNTPGYVQVTGEINGVSGNIHDYIIYDQKSLGLTKRTNHKFRDISSITTNGFSSGEIRIVGSNGDNIREANIMDAGIINWAFDERTINTSDEVLVFIFQAEVDHRIQDRYPIDSFTDT